MLTNCCIFFKNVFGGFVLGTMGTGMINRLFLCVPIFLNVFVVLGRGGGGFGEVEVRLNCWWVVRGEIRKNVSRSDLFLHLIKSILMMTILTTMKVIRDAFFVNGTFHQLTASVYL